MTRLHYSFLLLASANTYSLCLLLVDCQFFVGSATMAVAVSSSLLLKLPQEIKDVIWQYAFGNAHIPLYIDNDLDHWHSYNGTAGCEACEAGSPNPLTYEEAMTSARLSWARAEGPSIDERISRPYTLYNDHLQPLFTCREVFQQGSKALLSQLTLHIKSPEGLALVRRSAPLSLRQGATKLVVYMHFDHTNHFLWTMRLLEMHETFPNLKHLDINYHMRPPTSYDNLLDAIYLTTPVLGLKPPFDKPRYVLTETERFPSSTFRDDRSSKIIAATNTHHGTTIHTSYITSGTLFEAHFLGRITTADAINEHSSVMRSLFINQTYVSTAQMVLRLNLPSIRHSVGSAYPPYAYPSELLDRGFPNVSYLPGLQHALLQIARAHEKPWFEKLQRRRIVEIYMEQCSMSKEDAEALLARQLAAQPEGQGIDEFMEQLMMHGDGENEPEIPTAWQQEQWEY